jgi:hypothetical protein
MFRMLLVAAVLLIAPAEDLTYHATPGDPTSIQQEFTYALLISGPAGFVSKLVASNPALTIEHLRATRKGRRSFIANGGEATRVEIHVVGAHVDVKTRDTALQYDFDQSTAPADVAQDPIRHFSWGFSMAAQMYTLGSKGEYRLADQDGEAEPLAVILNAPVRLPDRPVDVGDQWNAEWTGSARKKDGGTMQFRQIARLEELAPAPSRRARISFSTTGTLNVPADKNPQGEELTLEAKGSVVLDLVSGAVVTADSAGTVTTDIKKVGVRLIHTLSSKSNAQ